MYVRVYANMDTLGSPYLRICLHASIHCMLPIQGSLLYGGITRSEWMNDWLIPSKNKSSLPKTEDSVQKISTSVLHCFILYMFVTHACLVMRSRLLSLEQSRMTCILCVLPLYCVCCMQRMVKLLCLMLHNRNIARATCPNCQCVIELLQLYIWIGMMENPSMSFL